MYCNEISIINKIKIVEINIFIVSLINKQNNLFNLHNKFVFKCNQKNLVILNFMSAHFGFIFKTFSALYSFLFSE